MSRRWNGSKSLQSKGYVRAQLKLGVCYGIGDGVAQDYVKAAEWFKKAADHGDADAQYLLGVFYNEGCGVTQDNVEAAKWFKKSADQGNEEAKVKLDELNRSRTSGCDYSRGAKKNEI